MFRKIARFFIIPQVSRIDKITENNTIKPPIESRLLIADFIEFPNISPKFESLSGIFFSLNIFSLKDISSFSFFQNLKK